MGQYAESESPISGSVDEVLDKLEAHVRQLANEVGGDFVRVTVKVEKALVVDMDGETK